MNQKKKLTPHHFCYKSTGFTLLELLIVIAILAILSATLLFLANPAEIFKKTRDTKRVSDLKEMSKTISYLIEQSGGTLDMDGPFQSNTCQGEASQTIYLSLVDSTSTCQTLIDNGDLPDPPSGWQYHCVTSQSDLAKVDGSGWLPINFLQATYLTPKIGVDPLNKTNGTGQGLFFSYVCDNDSKTFEINCVLESNKYSSLMSNDGGDKDTKYEIGNNLRLIPFSF